MEKKQSKFLYWLGCHHWMFYILSWTWGIIASLIGFIILVPFLITGKVRTFKGRLYGIFPKCFGADWGFSMGCFFFTAYNMDSELMLLCHESGHCMQNVLWGPLMMFVIYIPSFIRFWIYRYKIKKNKPIKREYEDIWFECQASHFGVDYILMPNWKEEFPPFNDEVNYNEFKTGENKNKK